MSELEEIKFRLRQFAQARDWDQFHYLPPLSFNNEITTRQVVFFIGMKQ